MQTQDNSIGNPQRIPASYASAVAGNTDIDRDPTAPPSFPAEIEPFDIDITLHEVSRQEYESLVGRVNETRPAPVRPAQQAQPVETGGSPAGYEQCAIPRLGASSGVALLKLYDVQEEVSRAIAHRLHDESAQMLAVIYLDLADIARDAPEKTATKIRAVVQKLDEVCEQLRSLSHELRPLILDQLGLMPGLQLLAEGVRKRSGLSILVEGRYEARLSKAVETVLYRVVQEALSNVARHAKATAAQIRLWDEGQRIYCSVSDNGTGLRMPDAKPPVFDGLGLVGINERVAALHGTCRIHSVYGKGTELQVEIPL
ncbi:MAG: hypothetical protein RLZZ227_381 [Pseudomonadota bacterium]